MTCARSWLAILSKLGADDLRLVGRFVELLIAADRAKADTARVMLDAQPEPADAEDARARLRAVTRYLET